MQVINYYAIHLGGSPATAVAAAGGRGLRPSSLPTSPPPRTDPPPQDISCAVVATAASIIIP